MTVQARVSICHRHPTADPITGFCGPCLRERLSYLDSPSSSNGPDLTRSKSFSSSNLPNGGLDVRRKSCDVRPRTSLSNLFRSELPKTQYLPDGEEEKEEGEDVKTMKEYIEIELEHNSSKRYSGFASVFTQKLQKWRIKQQNKKSKQPSGPRNLEIFKAVPPEKLIGRRSCDMDPRFSVDENPHRISFDEPRASWDGYMIARTIPRLAPMLSVIESAMIEDETNSISESSSSQRRNSFDCSSSGKSSSKHRMPVEMEELKSVTQPKESPVAKDLVPGFDHYDTPLKIPESGSKNAGSIKKKVLKIFGFKSKSVDTREIGHLDGNCEKQNGVGNGIANVFSNGFVDRRKSDVGTYNMIDSYHQSPTVAEIRGPATSALERNQSVRYSHSPGNFENGLSRIHLTPPLSRKKKSERKSVLNSQLNTRACILPPNLEDTCITDTSQGSSVGTWQVTRAHEMMINTGSSVVELSTSSPTNSYGQSEY